MWISLQDHGLNSFICLRLNMRAQFLFFRAEQVHVWLLICLAASMQAEASLGQHAEV